MNNRIIWSRDNASRFQYSGQESKSDIQITLEMERLKLPTSFKFVIYTNKLKNTQQKIILMGLIGRNTND